MISENENARTRRQVSKHTNVAVDDAIEQGELFINNTQLLNRAEGS